MHVDGFLGARATAELNAGRDGAGRRRVQGKGLWQCRNFRLVLVVNVFWYFGTSTGIFLQS